ncbi:MAG: DUF2461 domain-containing protein [Candidatus Neomarinimicrobiota bacterium]|jgi:uncharacterized protein (TIGR02453 family)
MLVRSESKPYTTEFSGFSYDTISFLLDLEKNNNHAWFNKHRQDYEEHLLFPLKHFVGVLGKTMLEIDSLIDTVPMINRTITKIYRDVRFTKDKSPFKIKMWIVFKRPRKDWKNAPAYFFELSSNAYRYGMGYYSATREVMDRYRFKIEDNSRLFLSIIMKLKKQSKFDICGDKYKRPIKKEILSDLADLYNRKNLYLEICNDIDSTLFSSSLIAKIRSDYLQLQPLYHFLLN